MRALLQGSDSNLLVTDPKGSSGPQVWPEPSEHFVLTPQLEELVGRALGYLRAGYPINLAGPAGTGKTTLALHLAAQLRQPVAVNDGDGLAELRGQVQGEGGLAGAGWAGQVDRVAGPQVSEGSPHEFLELRG